MTSLIFRVLDQHVVGGLADDPAIEDERGAMSYAQLLHESACLAGAMHHLGITDGSEVAIELSGRERVIAVLACARLGAIPNGRADFRFAAAAFHTPETEVSWDLLIKAGRTEPAPAPDRDPDGYESLMRGAYESIFGTLAAGGTIV